MPKYPPLKVIRHVSFDGGKSYKLWDDCTEQERQDMVGRDPSLWDKLCETARTEHPEWIA